MTWTVFMQALGLVFDPYVLWVILASSLFGLFVGVSIGIERIVDFKLDPDDILRNADLALYQAKAAGRDRTVVREAGTAEVRQ